MILVIDVGNSRMKWGLHGPHGWVAQGAVANAEIGTLALRDWQNLPRPTRAVGVNVAGEAARVRVEGAARALAAALEWLTATARGGRRRQPLRRGPRSSAPTAGRRWSRRGSAPSASELFPPPCVVVNAGTAVTIDALDADGVFRGGLILPGLR